VIVVLSVCILVNLLLEVTNPFYVTDCNQSKIAEESVGRELDLNE